MSQAEVPSDWRTCAADLFKHHESVLERLTKQNPSVDRADLHDAFLKAILEIATNPDKIEASSETKTEDFLTGCSQRSLLEILRTHRRRKKREEKKAQAVANDPPAARPMVDRLADCELAEQAEGVAKTTEERNVLRLWQLDHSDAEIAMQLSIPEQDARRIRDRVTQRLRRLGKQFDDQES